MKKLTVAELKEFRDRLYLEIPDAALEAELPPYYHPGENSDEIAYMKERRKALGGYLPKRVVRSRPLALPSNGAYYELRSGSGKQPVATTMAFVRLLKDLMKDPEIGHRFVPIIPDEARTFGMDSLFPTAKIYSPHGQSYEAVDRALLLSYKESEQGQILHEGISEAGAMASTVAAGTAYATHGTPMIPVYIFYSMFGFQRTGDQMWAMGDQLGRGFLLGATAGRTTLSGEGLQHNDGHSQLLASVSPACVAYDAAWAYELAVIVKDGLRRMYGASAEHPDGENIFYYLTVYNEPYVQPAQPEDYPGGPQALEEAILRGLYRYSAGSDAGGQNGNGLRARILASGVAVRWALDAQRLLAADWGVHAEAWSATSWPELVSGPSPTIRPAGSGLGPPRGERAAGVFPTPGRPPAGSSTWTPSRSPWRCSGSSSARATSSRRCSPKRSPDTGWTSTSARHSADGRDGLAAGPRPQQCGCRAAGQQHGSGYAERQADAETVTVVRDVLPDRFEHEEQLNAASQQRRARGARRHLLAGAW